MIVITLTDCPPALRGDLTKWLFEISTGVYVGNVSARVRENIWKRVQNTAKQGRATMVFSTNNEQRLDFRTHNSPWEIIDFDGLKLVLHPEPVCAVQSGVSKKNFSNAAKMRMAKKSKTKKTGNTDLPQTYIVSHIETTGISTVQDEIIKIYAIKICNNLVVSEFSALIKINGDVPNPVEKLTGISNNTLEKDGRALREVLLDFFAFVGDMPMVLHNARFDYDFLRAACSECEQPLFANRCIDITMLAKKWIEDVKNYKFETLLDYFEIATNGVLSAEEDCFATKQLYEKLIGFRNSL